MVDVLGMQRLAGWRRMNQTGRSRKRFDMSSFQTLPVVHNYHYYYFFLAGLEKKGESSRSSSSSSSRRRRRRGGGGGGGGGSSSSFFFLLGTFFRLQYPCGSLCTAPQLQPTRMGRRLLAGVACQRASARSLCRAGSGPPALHSPPRGNSSRDAAKARCAATARMPLHLTTHAALAAARREVGTSAARTRASKRMKVAASGAHLPPTSSPITTRRQRRARSSSG